MSTTRILNIMQCHAVIYISVYNSYTVVIIMFLMFLLNDKKKNFSKVRTVMFVSLLSVDEINLFNPQLN